MTYSAGLCNFIMLIVIFSKMYSCFIVLKMCSREFTDFNFQCLTVPVELAASSAGTVKH